MPGFECAFSSGKSTFLTTTLSPHFPLRAILENSRPRSIRQFSIRYVSHRCAPMVKVCPNSPPGVRRQDAFCDSFSFFVNGDRVWVDCIKYTYVHIQSA